ncbi:MAG: class I SAM-dependent methyltransferase [Acidimicrobiia bacterium]|nr:class I SAM-dependent methyltransferase [Acidimicrobiia bacterium]
MPRHGAADLYADPRLYELAFSYRDIPHEVDVLEAWYQRRRGGRPHRVLELAAGPAAHAIEFARRGATATALDASAAMCAYATRRSRDEGVALDVVEGDMVRFRLRRRFDLAVVMLDSASHVLDLDAMVSHLRSVGTHLVPGGLYVMEMSHPADFLAGSPETPATHMTPAPPMTQSRWRLARGPGRVDVRFTSPPRCFDPATQVTESRISVRVTEEGCQRVLRGRVALRRWTAVELDAAARLAGNVRVVQRYGSFDVDGPFGAGHPTEWRMISVLERTDERTAERTD